MQRPRQSRPAFRLVELVVAIVCVVILFGLFWPATQRIRGDDSVVECQNNLKQIGLAVHNYASAYNNVLPPLTSDLAKSKYGPYNASLFVILLPFVESNVLFESAFVHSPAATWAAPVPPAFAGPPTLQSWPFRTYQCPADGTIRQGLSGNQTTAPNTWAGCSYAANYQIFGTVNNLSTDGTPTPGWGNVCGPKYHIDNIPDGTANVVFFGEQFAACGATAGSLGVYPGIGNYSDTASYPVTPAGTGIVNTKDATNSFLWAPAFANSHPKYGFSSGGSNGSIYRHNVEEPAAAPINPPYAVGVYWDAPPQGLITQEVCDKARLQSFHTADSRRQFRVIVGMGDGTVRVITGKVSQHSWYAAVVPDDGTPFDSTW